MAYGLYISADGASAQSRRLEVIANNMANVDTVGFKRDLAVFQARYAEAVELGLQMPDTGAIEDTGGGVMFRETKTDHALGPLQRTRGRSDVAITGEGFFVVRKGNEDFLTRAGNFLMTPRGELVTQQGHCVQSDNGTPVVINPADPSWQFTPNGAVRQQGLVQNLAIVKPDSLGDLVKVGENLFRPLAQTRPVAPAERHVAPGHLEMSSVQPTTELIDMIQTSRFLEANINMMKAQDEMQRGLLNRVMTT